MVDFSNPSSFVPFLRAHKLTLNQFFLISCLYLEKYGELTDYATNVEPFPMKDLEELVDRKILIPPAGEENLKKQIASLDLFDVNKSFAEKIFVNNANASDEFWNKYPSFLIVDGQRHNARNYPIEDFRAYYGQLVANSKFQHQRMLDALEFAVDSNLLTMGMQKYFSTGYYLSMLAEMETNKGKKRVNETKII